VIDVVMYDYDGLWFNIVVVKLIELNNYLMWLLVVFCELVEFFVFMVVLLVLYVVEELWCWLGYIEFLVFEVFL